MKRRGTLTRSQKFGVCWRVREVKSGYNTEDDCNCAWRDVNDAHVTLK